MWFAVRAAGFTGFVGLVFTGSCASRWSPVQFRRRHPNKGSLSWNNLCVFATKSWTMGPCEVLDDCALALVSVLSIMNDDAMS